MIPALHLLLSALAYGSSAFAVGVTLSAIELGVWAWPAAGWFALCWGLVWGRSRGNPAIAVAVRRVVDALAVGVMGVFLFRVAAASEDGGDWRALAPVVLVIVQMLRALVVTTPGEAESFLATGLALAFYSSTRMDWMKGALFLAGYMWLWLAAMTLVQLLAEAVKRSHAGGRIAATADPWRTLRSGLWLSMLAVGMGIGGFLAIRGHAAGRGAGEGADQGTWSASGGGGSRYTTAVTFASQAGGHGRVEELYRIRAPKAISRFRLQAFDTYSPEGWSMSHQAATGLPEGTRIPVQYGLGLGLPGSISGSPASIEVAAVGAQGDALLTAGWPVEFDGGFPGALSVDEEGGVRTAYALPLGFRYRLETWVPAWDSVDLAGARPAGAARVGDRYFALPSSLPARVGQRAGEWAAAAASPWARAMALAGALRSARRYRLDLAFPPGAEKADPVDYFVFEADSGNCVNFATAFTVMVRALGMPARFVVGYLGHRWDAGSGEWTITTRDAHAWCEIALEGVGWVPVDPVPPARVGTLAVGGTETPAPSSEPAPAAAATEAAGRWWAGAAVAMRGLGEFWPWLALGGAGLWLVRAVWRSLRERMRTAGRRRARRASGDVQRAFQRVCEAAVRRGRERRESQTPAEYARSIRQFFPAVAGDILRLADLATAAEFSESGPNPAERAEAKELCRKLVAAMAKA